MSVFVHSLVRATARGQSVLRRYSQRLNAAVSTKQHQVYLQVLGNGACGSGPSIYLFSGHTKYLFNCGEGTQRLAHEHVSNLNRIEHIFLTKCTWDRFGGTPGMCLTLNEYHCEKVTIHGPPGIDKMLAAARKFIKIEELSLEVNTPKCAEPFVDSLMQVRYVHLQRDDKTDDKRAMAFVCKLHEQLGNFSLEKCVEIGVDTSELVMRLKNGNNVSLPDGRIVKPEDVLTSSSPSLVFIFIDVPDETFLKSLLDAKALNAHGSRANKAEDIAKIVVHFSSNRIVNSEDYQKWLSSFPSTTTHWFVNDSNTLTGQSAPHLLQNQLSLIDENIFPRLGEPYSTTKDLSGDELQTLNVFHLRPSIGFDDSLKLADVGLAEDFMTPELNELIKEYKSKVNSRTSKERAAEFPKVVTLGTGSGMPTKFRSNAANLINVNEGCNILLDCGDGTLAQLVRFYGSKAVDEVLKNLRMIFVSHLHADHHLGLIHLLNHRRKVTDEKLVLVAPAQIQPWLTFYNFGVEEIFSTYDFVSCTDLLSWRIDGNWKKEFCDRVNLTDVETCFVVHYRNAFGISIEMENSAPSKDFPKKTLKITYSGDAAPSHELVIIGSDSDLLIHEATMEDDLEKGAEMKKHSTISQALDAGRKMNAKHVILTHFSNRYAQIPLMKKKVEAVIAFDNMQITFNDLPSTKFLFVPLMTMFSKQRDRNETRATKRKSKEERETRQRSQKFRL